MKLVKDMISFIDDQYRLFQCPWCFMARHGRGVKPAGLYRDQGGTRWQHEVDWQEMHEGCMCPRFVNDWLHEARRVDD